MKTESLEIVSEKAPSPLSLMQAVIDKGVTAESVGVMERLVALHERMQEKDAEKQFAAAFVALQSEMPDIKASKEVPDRNGNVKFRFAPYEVIMEAVKPLLQKHGFTVTFSMQFSDGRVIQNCTLQHISGHSRTNQFAVRIGSGPPGSSEAQGDGAASTYAKRFAFCNALNITIEQDTDSAQERDVRFEGDVISAEQVMYLKEQVKETNSNEDAFLKFAGAAHYEAIRNGIYSQLVRSLEAKKRKA